MPSPSHRTLITRYQRNTPPTTTPDSLATEEPLEIRLADRPLTITMRTPGHDEELAAGFLLSEGLLHHRSDLLSISPCPHATDNNILNITPSPTLNIDFSKLTRHVFASSSCGLCGKATIDSICTTFPPIPDSPRLTTTPDTLLSLPQTLRQHQTTFSHTGGLHAAALFTPTGKLLVLREDVGRHNAVDKVLGHAFLHSLDLSQSLLLVSGRASFEILQKSLAARIPLIAAISAPSSLAAQFADQSNQTLVAFLRDDRFNLYTHPHRVPLP